ncbi:MAG TPA: flagellar M-ring protein FliF C-terminal domain-containing protein [Candidatus Tumulicola sp.]|nr:flagellar M-ring protein FliF C-terminal domain-containing protein [Candidatus Tumulicola sp.]
MESVAPILARWNALPRAARAALLAALTGLPLLAAIAGIVSHPPRVALFATPLHAEQLSEVEERLANWNVDFTPAADNVVVAAHRRNDLLLRLSLAGVPHPHVESSGEALANVGVLTPQAVIDAQSRAGLEGDIEAGLRGIDGLDDARVIVSPAKAAEFADQQDAAPSASVRLRLRSGVQLSRAAVAGIRAFVAAGVPGLQPARVTIVDDRGVALDDREIGSDAGDLQRSLQSALDGAFGEGTTIVRVHAEYRADRTDERDVRRTALGGPIARTARSDAFDGTGRRFRHNDASEDRGSETHEWSSQSPGGEIERLSTAVFVDVARGLDLAKVRDFASAAVGYDAARGDALAVSAVDFHHATAAPKNAWWLLYGTIVPLAPAVAIAIGLFAAARIGIRPLCALLQTLAERAWVRRASRTVSEFPPSRVRSALAQEPPHAAAAIISALPAATAAAVLELYPPHERDAIVKRMQRPHSPLLADAGDLLRRHA